VAADDEEELCSREGQCCRVAKMLRDVFDLVIGTELRTHAARSDQVEIVLLHPGLNGVGVSGRSIV
jgi:hypothetical protein